MPHMSNPSIDPLNPKDIQGQKKTPLRLIMPVAIAYLAHVMRVGAVKYSEYNWREKKIGHSVYLEAALRHIFLAMDGEDQDEETGLPHEAHAMACLAIILDAKESGSLKEDRHPSHKLQELMKRLQAQDREIKRPT